MTEVHDGPPASAFAGVAWLCLTLIGVLVLVAVQ